MTLQLRNWLVGFGLLLLTPTLLLADAPLHERIDAQIGGDGPLTDDAAFLRRVSLDLTGVIPTADQARAFVADESPNKRETLIDQLLASPRYARRMQYVFDVMLMERRADKHVKQQQWRDYLHASFAENKPWDVLTTELLTADGADPATRPAAKFILDRELKPEEVVRDLGRVFLGRDFQCAQCHDHPNVNDYLQRHYYGLAAFLNRSYLFKDPKTKLTSIGEKAEGVVEFTSVFTQESGKTPPRMLDQSPLNDPELEGEAYKVKPAKNVRSIPVHSRRLQLAAAMTDPANTAFSQNIVNRLWAVMLGRGFVEPVDMWHSDNPPTHPELLEELAAAFQEQHYDIKFLLREIALSQTYQRSSQLSGGDPPTEESFQIGLLRGLSPEQLGWSMMQATGLAEQTLTSVKAKQASAKKDADKADDPVWAEKAQHDALKANVDIFAKSFGVVGVQTSRFDASADQALFLLNGATLQKWLIPGGSLLTERMKKMEPPAAAEELYFAVFSRPPTPEEAASIAELLEGNKENPNYIKELVWAALTSAEFRFNH